MSVESREELGSAISAASRTATLSPMMAVAASSSSTSVWRHRSRCCASSGSCGIFAARDEYSPTASSDISFMVVRSSWSVPTLPSILGSGSGSTGINRSRVSPGPDTPGCVCPGVASRSPIVVVVKAAVLVDCHFDHGVHGLWADLAWERAITTIVEGGYQAAIFGGDLFHSGPA